MLTGLIEMSRRYGNSEEFVLAGGGNTSYKEGGTLYVKESGTQLSDITAGRFVAMDEQRLCLLAGQPHISGPEDAADMGEAELEQAALREMMAARLPGNESKLPSVEAVLHAIFPYKYVLHLHPALVNGLTCGYAGEKICRELFEDGAVWIKLTKSGISLSRVCKEAFDTHSARSGKYPQLVFLQNHGIFIAADSTAEIDKIFLAMWSKLIGHVSAEPDFGDALYDAARACSIAPALRMLYDEGGMAVAVFCTNRQVIKFVSDSKTFEVFRRPFTAYQIVHSKDEPLFIDNDEDIRKAFRGYEKRKGYKPKIVAVQGLGFFALGSTKKEAEQARMLFLDAVKIAVYAGSFGGALHLPDDFTQFIMGREVESYRIKVSQAGTAGGRLEGRIVLITGAAQGFGKGIAEAMASEGAYVAVADLNMEGAEACAAELCEAGGAHAAGGSHAAQGPDPYRALAVAADVSDEASAERMIQAVVLAYGGLDVLVSNAGVLIAGSLGDMSVKDFDFVTDVNYKGYFLCAKYASVPMKIQHEHSPGYLTDIIEINSKSGLEGSKKNFAYAGSKFGGIGLTQSFALELVEYGIKVNAVCPGNLLDGPLWSDPERGLFRQYLDSGKVPGAKSVADVRRFYEDRVPLKRGCTVDDVARAVFYIIEQKYETGQAIPVTGGQVMMR